MDVPSSPVAREERPHAVADDPSQARAVPGAVPDAVRGRGPGRTARPDPAGMALAGSGLDRAAWVRTSPEVIAAHLADPATRILPFWQGRALLRQPEAEPGAEGACDDPVLGRGLAGLAPDHPLLAHATGAPVFLGLSGGAAVFACDLDAWAPDGPLPDGSVFLDPSEQAHPDLPAGAVFADLRPRLSGLDLRAGELVATGRALLEWHRTHRFCSCCGVASDMVQAGWMRRCPACQAQHFPRTDPVVIMLVTRGNSVLLGRSPGWPERMYSCLAGFMEPGECIEDAVRREVVEETGVGVGPVSIIASQPWPFPASLMLGCRAEATSDAITVDPAEIEDAIWVTRERLLSIMSGTDPVVAAPRVGAIAGWLMREWLADRLS